MATAVCKVSAVLKVLLVCFHNAPDWHALKTNVARYQLPVYYSFVNVHEQLKYFNIISLHKQDRNGNYKSQFAKETNL